MVRSSASSGITEAQSFSENSQLHDSKNRKINCIKLWRISEYSKVFAAQMHRCHHQCRHWSQLQESEGYPFKSQDWKTHGTIEALNRSGFQLWPACTIFIDLQALFQVLQFSSFDLNIIFLHGTCTSGRCPLCQAQPVHELAHYALLQSGEAWRNPDCSEGLNRCKHRSAHG